jgi:hypothetical protein
MARPQVEVKGAKELRKQLKAAGDDLGDLKATHKKIAQIVEFDALQLAPVVTGGLVGSIRASGTQTAAIVRAGRSSVRYAGPIHWGWPARNITAQPFLVDAQEAKYEDWMSEYTQMVDKALDRIAGDYTNGE